ncbi:hypothetical protein [Nocardia pseudovaccinii]|uniref:hypothetical protein n=1 Tax=Nocardia pseudovaccinii TaxID=189540 RepID=UPI0007A38C09|nr:hypothetical protein [Nocardia pseudovaccinii]
MAELLGCGLGAVLVGDEGCDGLAEGLGCDLGEFLAAGLAPQAVEVVWIPDAAVAVGEDQIRVVVDSVGFDAPESVDDELGQDHCPGAGVGLGPFPILRKVGSAGEVPETAHKYYG